MVNVNSSDTTVGNTYRPPAERSNEQLLDDRIHDPVAPGLGGQMADDMPTDEYQAARRKVMRSYESMMAALSPLISKRDEGDLDVELASAIEKMKEVIGDVQTTKLLNDNERKRLTLHEKQQKIQEAEENLTQAAEKSEKKSLWAKITAIFTVVAAAVELVLGAITCVANPVAGVAMMASGALGVVLAADSIAEAFNGAGFLSGDAKVALMACMGVLTVISIGGCLGLGSKAMKAAKSLSARVSAQTGQSTVAQSAATAGQSASNAARQTANTVGRASVMAEAAGNVMSGIAQTGEIAGTIVVASYDVEIGELRSDAGRARADAKAIEAMTLLLDEFIDVLMNQMSGQNSRCAAMLEEIMASMEDRGESQARVRFSG